VLGPRFGQRLIGSISSEEIERLTAELLQKHNSESAVANTLKPLRGTLDFAHRHKKWIARNPAGEISDDYRVNCNATRKHHEWTSEEVARLIEVAYERDTRPDAKQEYGLAIEAKVRLGLRLGELLGLKFGDIVLEEVGGQKRAVTTIRRQWSNSGQVKERTKGKVGSRRVPLTPTLYRKIVERRLRLGATDEDFVFAAKRGGNPPQQSNFRRRGWNATVVEAGLRVEDGVRITPHDARHAAVSQWAHLGLTPAQAGALVGHSSTRVTEGIYTHAFNRHVEEETVRQAMLLAEGTSS
jgi:integrase